MSEHLEFAAIHEEHRQLLASLERIEDLIRPGETGRAAALRGELDRLPGALERHFAREEAGVFRAMEADHPEWGDALDALRCEHGAVLAALAAIRDRSARLRGSALVAGVRRDAGALLARLRRHEHRETALLQEAVSRDVGTSALA